MLYSGEPDQHYLSQVIKVNINRDKVIVTVYDLDLKMALYLCSFPSPINPG